jgi:hypothetical protein
VTVQYLALCAICVAFTSCAPTPEPTQTPAGVIGYWYHDANHQNEVVSPSPQAIENARHGVWLWPPASTTRPG